MTNEAAVDETDLAALTADGMTETDEMTGEVVETIETTDEVEATTLIDATETEAMIDEVETVMEEEGTEAEALLPATATEALDTKQAERCMSRQNSRAFAKVESRLRWIAEI